ncbi:MAG: 50S ribosomal protein L33 [Mycoplasmatales bacterium]
MKKKAILVCEECLTSNYAIKKNPNSEERIMVKKYCRKCNKHTVHKENK